VNNEPDKIRRGNDLIWHTILPICLDRPQSGYSLPWPRCIYGTSHYKPIYGTSHYKPI